MKKILYKVAKISGLIVLCILVLMIIIWLVGSIAAPIKIPEGNEVEYVKGIWLATPMDQFRAYQDMDRLKQDGVNTLSIGPFVPNHFFAIVQRPFIAEFVKKAHREGFAVHLVPNSWGPWTDISKFHPQKQKLLEREAIYWSKFAEKYNVKYFSPQNEPDVLLGNNQGAKYAQGILPSIREFYTGKVLLKLGKIFVDDGDDFDYNVMLYSFSETDKAIDAHLRFSDSSGYDYLMIDIFPPSLEHDNREFIRDVQTIIESGRIEVEKKGLQGVMIGEFGYLQSKPEYSKEIMPGMVVTEQQQADYLDEYLNATMLHVDGVIYCGWSMEGYGIKGYQAEEVIKKWFKEYINNTDN